MSRYLFTSESVTEGHPDKICDQISDGILDAILAQDKNARVACETTATTGMVLIMGEISTSAHIDIPGVARKVISDIGYDGAVCGFDSGNCAVITSIDEQSPDIAMGVDNALEGREEAVGDIGAGDQGMMFGYACNETKELMPLTASLAHALAKRLAEVPDGKTQVTVEYDDGTPIRVDTVVVSSQHTAETDENTLRADIVEKVIKAVIPADMIDADTKYFINPTGRFVVGGPQGDSGLTGRKIIVDTYGGVGRHGGGSFSGKDPTKVDRSAAYAARYAAKNIVAAGIASRCEVQLAYAIGVAHPVSVFVDTFGTGIKPDSEIADAVKGVFDFRPSAIISELKLRDTLYRPLAAYGHMGREDLGVAWEKTDKTEQLKAALGI